MVRLKAPLLAEMVALLTKFQFHYGSVKSGVDIFEYDPNSKFQFHYGSVKRKPEITTKVQWPKISIPLWFG